MKINQIINEGISSVLFHATTFTNAEKMLRADTMGKESLPEVSFTRSLIGKYHTYNKQIGVIFEMDGRKLGQKYKGQPVGTEDWWDIEDEEHENFGKTGHGYRGRENGQLEDRVFGPIVNFTSYVKNAIIFTPIEYAEAESQSNFGDVYSQDIKRVDAVIELLEEYGIPYRYVATEKDLANRHVNDIEGFNRAIARIKGEYDDDYDDYDYDSTPTSSERKYVAFMSLSEYDEENDTFDTKETADVEIMASSIEDAWAKADAHAEQLNKKLPKDSSYKWSVYDLEDAA